MQRVCKKDEGVAIFHIGKDLVLHPLFQRMIQSSWLFFQSLDQELLHQEILRGNVGIDHVTWAVSRIDSERATAWKKEDEDYVKDLIRKSAAFSHLQKGCFKISLCGAESGTNEGQHLRTGNIKQYWHIDAILKSAKRQLSKNCFLQCLSTMPTVHCACVRHQFSK